MFIPNAAAHFSASRQEHDPYYRPDVDGLRAVAVLAVVGFHAFPEAVPGGFTGVDVFFVISGFLISSIILRDLSRKTFSFAKFYARRVKRIFPALIVILGIIWMLGWLVLLPDEYQTLGTHMAAGAGFALNLLLYRDTDWYFGSTETPLVHLWSLGVEEQFYIFWPVFLVLTWRFAQNSLLPLLAVALLSFGFNADTVNSDSLSAFYLPTSRLWELAAGAVLAHLQLPETRESARRVVISSRWAYVSRFLSCDVRGVFGLGLLVFSFWGINSGMTFPGWRALAPVTGSLLLISAGTSSWLNRLVLARHPMVLIGLISYPLYLWHWPLLSFSHIVLFDRFTPATAMGMLVLSFVLALLTYKYVELPIRSSPQVKLRVVLPLVAGMIMCGTVGYLNSIRYIPSRPLDKDVARILRAAPDGFPPTSATHPLSKWLHWKTLITVGTASRHVLFIGDSNILQYYSRIEKIMLEHPQNSRNAVFAMRPACAIGASDVGDNSDDWTIECRKFLQEALDYAKDPSVDTVVIGASWYIHFVMYRDTDHIGEQGLLRPETDRALSILSQAMGRLTASGKRVYLLLQIPVGINLNPLRMIQRTILTPGFTLSIPVPTRRAVMNVLEPIDTKLLEVARRTGAIPIDPIPALCESNTCPAVTVEGDPVYFDAYHLSPSYVRSHVQYLDQVLLDRPPKVQNLVAQPASGTPQTR